MINILETAQEVNEARTIQNPNKRREALLRINAKVNDYDLWLQVLEVAAKIKEQ